MDVHGRATDTPAAGGPPPTPPISARTLMALSIGCLVAACLSTVQIYLRQQLADQDPALLRLAVLNLIAWAPWVPIAVGAVALARRAPVSRSTIALHVMAALGAAVTFLAYLAAFRLVAGGVGLGLGALWAAFWVEVADFFLVCLLLWAAILAIAQNRRSSAERQAPGQPATDAAPRLEVRSQGVTRFVDPHEIDWISAEGSYVGLHVGERRLLLRGSLGELAERLADLGFVRIHRSTVVNRDRVVAQRPRARGDAEVELRDGTVLRMSRRYRAPFDGRPAPRPQHGRSRSPQSA